MKRWMIGAAMLVFALVPLEATAQLRGHHVLGDQGLYSGTQPGRGAYFGAMVPFYTASKVKDADGNEIGGSGSLTMWGIAPMAHFVTELEILGAHYGFKVVVPFVSAAPEIPRLDADSGFGFGDIQVVPLQLGWHWDWTDAIFQYSFFAPTGRYSLGALDNRGLGMWSHEFALGLTYHIDNRWHVSTTAYYEIHGDKKDTNVRVGDILTLEGGLGLRMPDGRSMVGAAYYAQWKTSADSVAGLPLRGLDDHRVFGIGPEVRLLNGMIRLAGYFEINSRSYYQGISANGSVVLPF